jgi:hypothetical protein
LDHWTKTPAQGARFSQAEHGVLPLRHQPIGGDARVVIDLRKQNFSAGIDAGSSRQGSVAKG